MRTRSVAGWVMLAVCACGRIGFDPQGGGSAADGTSRDAPCTFGPWSNATIVPELSSNLEDYSPAVSADGRTMILGSNRAGGTGGLDLWYATRPLGSLTFDSPIPLAGLNSPSDDASPSLSADGLTLYFDSVRNGPGEIFVSQRATTSDLFTVATPLVGPFPTAVTSPEISDDGLALYFESPGPGAADLWVATRTSPGAAWSAPVQLAVLNTMSNESDPVIDVDGLTFYFTSDRLEVASDLFVATRPDPASPFSNPTLLRLGIAPGVGEYGVDISADGTTMLLSVNQGPPALTNIWQATRTCLQ